MSDTVVPITFLNKKSLKLFGILHKPDIKTKKDVGIIILSPGIKSRVAPHRLYVKMASRFCSLGFDVFRFDPEGLSDSEGEIDEHFTADLYGSIQVGQFIDDTISAMDWMEKECGLSRFILSGLCGGAITGLLTGVKDQRVDSLLGLGIPVILDGSKVDHSKYITKGQLKSLQEGYFNKLFNVKAWLRFFLFKSDYLLIIKSLLQNFTKVYSKSSSRLDMTQVSKKPLQDSNSNFNPHFPPAFHQMVSSRKVLLLFSEKDRLYWEFEEKYVRPYQEDYEKYKSNIEVHFTKDANHIFSLKEWQENMFNQSVNWLIDNYR